MIKRIAILISITLVSCHSAELVPPIAISLNVGEIASSYIDSGGKVYFKANVTSGKSYIVCLLLADNKLFVGVATNEYFNEDLIIQSNGFVSKSIVEWRFSNVPSDLYLYVDGSNLKSGQYFKILLLPIIEPRIFHSEGGHGFIPPDYIKIIANTVKIGETNGSESLYAVENLEPGKTYVVYIFGLVNDADLRLYPDLLFIFELNETLREIDSPSIDPEEVKVLSTGNIYFSVAQGPASISGSGYYILVLETN